MAKPGTMMRLEVQMGEPLATQQQFARVIEANIKQSSPTVSPADGGWHHVSSTGVALLRGYHVVGLTGRYCGTACLGVDFYVGMLWSLMQSIECDAIGPPIGQVCGCC